MLGERVITVREDECAALAETLALMVESWLAPVATRHPTQRRTDPPEVAANTSVIKPAASPASISGNEAAQGHPVQACAEADLFARRYPRDPTTYERLLRICGRGSNIPP